MIRGLRIVREDTFMHGAAGLSLASERSASACLVTESQSHATEDIFQVGFLCFAPCSETAPCDTKTVFFLC